MIYRENPKNGDKISQLGLGCMRFPRKGTSLDQSKADAVIARAIELGINYFDAAYIYPGSEAALGSALKKLGKRSEVKIATKLPPFMCKSANDFDKIFNKQLERLQTDYIDYYMLHMLGNTGDWERMRSLCAENWLAEKLSTGQIRNIGFSFHGGRGEFMKLIDAFDWGFAMVQYNYYDENNQAGKEGIQYASAKGVPIFIMEPLRGGMLTNELPKSATDAFAGVDKTRPLAEWGLGWLFDQSEPVTVLSGMSNLNMLEQNVEAASKFNPSWISEPEREVYAAVLNILNATVRVPCTGCNYCMPCPKGVDIPACFAAYNASYTQGFGSGIREYMQTVGGIQREQRYASQCSRCRKCEANCPQSIKISDSLTDVSRRLESFWFRPVFALARRIMLGK